MIKHVYGDILDVKEGVIIQQVNAQGVMSSGLAKAIYEKWPIVKQGYHKWVKPNQEDSGLGYMGQFIPCDVTPNIHVLSVVGQQYYGHANFGPYTSYDALLGGLTSASRWCMNGKETKFYIPWKLGCGLAGGNWAIVRTIITEVFKDKDLTLVEKL